MTVITPKLSQEMKIMINSDSDDLEYIDKLLSQSILPHLISLSRNLTASPLPSSIAPVMTRTAHGVTRKKTYRLVGLIQVQLNNPY